jgi:hypothetical protein
MADDALHNDEDLAAKGAGAMPIFKVKSDASPDLGAFSGDLAGLQLPSQFKLWRVVGGHRAALARQCHFAYDKIKRGCGSAIACANISHLRESASDWTGRDDAILSPVEGSTVSCHESSRI